MTDVTRPKSEEICGLELRLTCASHPEQYDVYQDDRQVAYLRLRHGTFRAQVPDPNGKTVYLAEPTGDGMFASDAEREEHLKAAVTAVLDWMGEIPF